MTFRRILVDQEREARVIRGYTGFVRRTLMQALRRAIEIRQIVIRAINRGERIERFAPRKGILRDPQPKLFGFGRKIPFRREPRQVNFALGPIGGGPLGGTPERRKLGVGRGLARLPASRRPDRRAEDIPIRPRSRCASSVSGATSFSPARKLPQSRWRAEDSS